MGLLVTAGDKLGHTDLDFRSLFESLPGLYLVLKPDFSIVAVSDAYLKATMTERSKILGKDLFEVFPDNPESPRGNGVSNLRASLQRVLQTARADTMAIQKYDVQRPDGVFEERFWSPINSPMLNGNGQVEFIIHRVEDVTEFIHQKSPPDDNHELRTRLEQMEAEAFQNTQEIQATNQRLREVNQELEAFSYSVSHDLRSPLRNISRFVELLQEAGSSTTVDSKAQYLKRIAQDVTRMDNLIQSLLSFSRMGKTELQRRKVDMTTLLNEARKGLQHATDGRQISWSIGTLPRVHADVSLMLQVWTNLVGNAIKYTRTSFPAEIVIGCSRSEASEWVFFVQDNGVGFDMRYVDKLFGVFQRLHPVEEFEGTGLGLANVRRIITRHGGKTWAEGKVGHGATIYFSLPDAHQ